MWEEFLSRRLFVREDAQEVTGKFQGSPRKKGQGQDLALTPLKQAFFSIETNSNLMP